MLGIGRIRKLADRVYSRLVRLRAADKNGMTKCVTCGKRCRWDSEQMQAGHLRTRGHYSVRYDADNVFAQCRTCNYYGDPARLKEYYIGLYGEAAYDELVRRSNKLDRRTVDDYVELIRQWKAELKERGDWYEFDAA